MLEFKKGDIVKLKSGGPTMTVQGLGNYGVIEDGVLCVWFEGKKHHSEVFDRAVLELDNPPRSSSGPLPFGG